MKNKQSWINLDVSVGLLLGIFVYVLATSFHLHQRLQRYETYILTIGIDIYEIITAIALLAFYLLFLAIRDKRSLAREVKRRLEVEAKLAEGQLGLEEKIKARASDLVKINEDLKQEIALRKKTENELVNIQREMEFVLGATKTGLDIIDSNYNVRYMDPEWAKVYGDYRGRKCYEYFMGRDQVCPDCGLAKAFATKEKVVTQEILGKEANRPIEVITIPFQDQFGEWLAAEINIDITERKQQEAELAEYHSFLEEKVKQQTTAIHDSEVRYRRLFEAARDGILILEAKTGLVTDVNHFFLDMLGYGRDEVIGKKFWEITALKNTSELAKHVFQHLQKNDIARYEGLLFKMKGDGFLEMEIVGNTYGVEGQEFTQLNIRDITERVGAQEALKESEDRFKTFFDQSRDGLLLADPETRQFVLWNKTICDMLGYKSQEIEGLAVKDIHPAEDVERIISLFEKQVHGFSGVAGEIPMKRKDGSVFYADLSTSTITLIGKKYLLGSFRDATERRNAQAKEREYTARLENLTKYANDVIIFLDENFYLLEVNDRVEDFYGYTKKEMIGKCAKDLRAPETKEKFEEQINFARTEGRAVFETVHQRKDGTKIPVEISLRAIDLAGKNFYQAIIRDITERKKTEELKMNFMNMVSHELRTPLSVIKESVALVFEGRIGEVNDKQKDMLVMAKNNVDRLVRLVNQVLDFQRIDAGKMTYKFAPHDINKIVEEIAGGMAALAKKKGLELTIHLDESIPAIIMDEDKIAGVLTNLFVNALNYTDRGAITATTSRGDNFVQVSVADTGAGIRSGDIPKLFHRFSQLQRKPGGAGLGLSICKEIIDMHKGKIWAESTFGNGTTFCFVLPIKERRHRDG